MEKKLKKARIRISLIVWCFLLMGFCMPIYMAKGAVEEEPAQQIMTLDQLNSGSTRAGPRQSDYFTVAFILLSLGAMLNAGSSHWVYCRRKELRESESDKLHTLNSETSDLKNYIDSAQAIRDFNLDIAADIEPHLDRLLQLQREYEQALHDIDNHTQALQGDNAKAIENLMRRHCL